MKPYTPIPWIAREGGAVMKQNDPMHNMQGESLICSCDVRTEEGKANQRLIAHAPELLFVLRGLIDADKQGVVAVGRWDHAEGLISRITKTTNERK